MISAQFLCTKACNLHHYIRVPSPLRLARAHKPLPFTRAFYTPVETRPTPPAGVMPGDRPVTATCPVQEKVFATSGRDIPLVGPEQQRESRIYYENSYAAAHYRYKASLRYSPGDGRYLLVRHPPCISAHQIWHYQRDPDSPRDVTGHRQLVGLVRQGRLANLRLVAKYIPEWVFVVCHPSGEGEALLIFSIFLEKARLSEPGWLIIRSAYRPDAIADMALVKACISLIEADRRETAYSTDLLAYFDILLVKVIARFDALQYCVDCQRRPNIAPTTWFLVRRLAQFLESRFTRT